LLWSRRSVGALETRPPLLCSRIRAARVSKRGRVERIQDLS
jgi:hypothetical protein